MSDKHSHDHDHSEKQRPAHYPETIENDSRYWKSVGQWENDPEFKKRAEREFLNSPLAEVDENSQEGGWARREFLKLMGASLALAGAGCIRRPVQKIVPYANQPEEVTLGIANYYSSTWSDGYEAFGLLVKSREGRPIKIEGNPEHPMNKGALSARAQAEILKLYDPDRLQGPKHNLLNKEKTNHDTVDIAWASADAKVVESLKKGGVALLTGNILSPSLSEAVSQFTSSFNATHSTWQPITQEDIQNAGQSSYGTEAVPNYRFDKAQIIVSIDADFLGTWISPVKFTRQFAKGRKDIPQMNRLYVFDSGYSLTGANADLRYKIKPSQQIDVVMGLAHELVVKKSASSYASSASVKSALEPFAKTAEKIGMDPAAFAKVASDLWDNRGKSLVVAGGLSSAHSVQLQIAVNFLNSILGNEGQTVIADNANTAYKASHESLEALIQKMNQGQVKTLIIHGVNPVYNLPINSGFFDALKKVEMVVYTGDRIDETGMSANILAPDHHSMEAWSDLEFEKGLYSIQQPTIQPMYNTRGFFESLVSWMKLAGRSAAITKHETAYDHVREYWKTNIFSKNSGGMGYEDFWIDALHKGVVGSVKDSGSARSFRADALNQVKPVAKTGFELMLYPTVALGAGEGANISWLQELPDPVTKITWENYLSVSIDTAQKNALKDGDIVELEVSGRKIEVPVHVQPGLHNEVLTLAIGYGRTHVGRVGNGLGVNAYSVAQYKSGKVEMSALTATFKKTGQKTQLACTQEHHSMEGRQIVTEATLKEYNKDNGAGIHRHKVFSIWPSHKYNGHKWGMVIDLNSCTGCSACMTACQSENNIPVVGKRYVIEGREMHWIRVDRYYTNDPVNAETVFQPMLCQHCDNAPCESVCPVLATVHSDEGLNEMVYNRCVGTRYCSNNCPYKVRRFNWFNNHKNTAKPLNMALNPEVTVRPRGVMEKCTFCVQRIKEVKSKVRVEGREMKDGDIKTACQVSCPTDAITFGDLNDKNSRVAKLFKEDARSYAVLEEWNAAPSIRYMTKIRNTDQETLNRNTSYGQVTAPHKPLHAPTHAAAEQKGEH